MGLAYRLALRLFPANRPGEFSLSCIPIDGIIELHRGPEGSAPRMGRRK